MIPTTIKLAGHNVPVRILPTRVGSSNAEYDTWNNAITLSDTHLQSPDIQEQTFCHEILELMIEQSGLRYYLQQHDSSTSGHIREQICQSLENIFWRFLKDETNFFEEK